MNEVEQKNRNAHTVLGDHRLWWLALLAILGTVVFLSKYSEAFPSAVLDLSVPRQQIAEKALDWAHKLGYNKQHTINSTTFYEDENAKTFLEFALGSQSASDVMRSEIPIWMWATRFCKEREYEECSVFLAPDGRFLKFAHNVANDLALPSLSYADAEELSHEFIEKTANFSLDGYKLISNETVTQLRRKDYRFIYENRKTDYKGARWRIAIQINGNQVGGMNGGLHLPEEWNRRYDKMRSYNAQLFSIANGFYNTLIAIAAVVFLWAVTHHNIRWKTTLLFAAIFAAIQVGESLNNFPTIVSQYDPVKLSYNAYITDQIMSRVFAAVGLFAVGVIFAGAAEVIYRSTYPHRVAMENWFTPRALATTEISKALVLGHIIPLISLGWVIAYYVLGKHIGFFTPISVENYKALASSIVPAFSAVSLGFFASTHEEVVYRVVALCLSMSLLRKIPGLPKNSPLIFWICNLFQAAAWGFMHSTYPQQPSYARGLELTCSGLLFGWTFQAFGLLPCLICHYLLDCYLDSRILLSSGQPMLVISALVAICPFFLMALYSFKKRSAILQPDDLSTISNEHVSALQYRPPVQEREAPKHFQYNPLTPRTRICWSLAVLASLLIGVASWRPLIVGRNTHLRVDRAQAEKLGDQSIRARGMKPSQFRRVAWLSSDSVGEELQYVWEKVGPQAAVRFANLEDFGFTWTLRYFNPLQIDEYRVLLDGRGVEYAVQMTESEDAPGATLTESQAIKLATDFILKNHPEFLPVKFDSIQETRRENRIDYRLFFESPSLRIGDAPSKAQVRINGDKIADFKQGWELPDTWKEDFESKKFKDEVANMFSMAYKLVLIVLSIWWFIGLFRSGAVKWRVPLIISAGMALLAVITEFNSTLTLFEDYPTTNMIDTFISKQVMDSIQRLLWSTVFTIIPAAVAFAVFKLIAPETSINAVLRVGFRPADDFERRQQRQMWLDAVVCGFGIAVLRWSLSMVSIKASSVFSPAVQATSLWAVTHLANVYYPQLDITVECLTRSIKECFNTALFAGLYQKYAGSFRKAALFLPPLMLVQFCQERFWQDYVIVLTHSLADWILFYLFVAKFARRNIFAYLMYGVCSEILTRLPILGFHAGRVMLSEIIWCLVILLLPVGWVFWLFSNKIAPVAPAGGSGSALPGET